MFDKTDYTNLSLEELLAKQTSLTKRQKILNIIAFVSVGVTLFAIYKKSNGFMNVIFILGSLFFLSNNSSELKKVEVEINKRKN